MCHRSIYIAAFLCSVIELQAAESAILFICFWLGFFSWCWLTNQRTDEMQFSISIICIFLSVFLLNIKKSLAFFMYHILLFFSSAFEALQRGIEDSQRFMTCLFATTIATQLCHMQWHLCDQLECERDGWMPSWLVKQRGGECCLWIMALQAATATAACNVDTFYCVCDKWSMPRKAKSRHVTIAVALECFALIV